MTNRTSDATSDQSVELDLAPNEVEWRMVIDEVNALTLTRYGDGWRLGIEGVDEPGNDWTYQMSGAWLYLSDASFKDAVGQLLHSAITPRAFVDPQEAKPK